MRTKLIKVFILLVITVTIFLIYSNRKINGIWIGTYISYDNSKYNSINESLINFNTFNFKYINPYLKKDSIIKRNYITLGNLIFSKPINEFETIQTKIVNFKNDSLILKSVLETKAYRKIPDSLKSNSNQTLELKNKFFKIENQRNIDTIYFSEKYLFFKGKKKKREKWESTGYWKLIYFENYYVIFSNFSPIVVNKSNEYLNFNQLTKDRNNVLKVIEIEGKINDIEIIKKNIEMNQ
ncbi:hypothetical protein [Polaribacter butkevichii]|uniref:hypothetical protein n=1 Tax=Polaribacter butkevichii TaxID=218490 RepID=UPI0030F77D86